MSIPCLIKARCTTETSSFPGTVSDEAARAAEAPATWPVPIMEGPGTIVFATIAEVAREIPDNDPCRFYGL